MGKVAGLAFCEAHVGDFDVVGLHEGFRAWARVDFILPCLHLAFHIRCHCLEDLCLDIICMLRVREILLAGQALNLGEVIPVLDVHFRASFDTDPQLRNLLGPLLLALLLLLPRFDVHNQWPILLGKILQSVSCASAVEGLQADIDSVFIVVLVEAFCALVFVDVLVFADLF